MIKPLRSDLGYDDEKADIFVTQGEKMKSQVNFKEFCEAIQKLDLDTEEIKAPMHTSRRTIKDWIGVEKNLKRK